VEDSVVDGSPGSQWFTLACRSVRIGNYKVCRKRQGIGNYKASRKQQGM
jgi:hypothetical protein